jgi:hypothetical protein
VCCWRLHAGVTDGGYLLYLLCYGVCLLRCVLLHACQAATRRWFDKSLYYYIILVLTRTALSCRNACFYPELVFVCNMCEIASCTTHCAVSTALTEAALQYCSAALHGRGRAPLLLLLLLPCWITLVCVAANHTLSCFLVCDGIQRCDCCCDCAVNMQPPNHCDSAASMLC